MCALEQLKQSLLQEITEILTSQRGSAKQVLKFIRESSKKDFPFVHVYHPLKSDITALLSSLETVQKLHDPAVVECGLTVKCLYHLHTELTHSFKDLKSALKAHCVDKVGTLVAAFVSIQESFDTKQVKSAWSDVQQLLRMHAEAIVRDCQVIIDKGTGITEGEFYEKDVRLICDHLQELQIFHSILPSDTLRGIRTSESMREGLEQGVLKLQQSLRDALVTSQYRQVHLLHKLRLWSSFSVEGVWSTFQGTAQQVYEEEAAHLAGLIQMKISQISMFDQSQMNDIEHHIQLLRDIKQLDLNAAQLSGHNGIDTNILDCSKAYSTIADIAKEVATLAQNRLPNIMEHNQLKSFQDQANSLEMLRMSLQDTPLDDSMLTCVSECCCLLSSAALNDFSQRCTIQSIGVQSGMLDSLEESMCGLKTLQEAYGQITGNEWNSARQEYGRVQDEILVHLLKEQVKMETLGREVENHGVIDPQAHIEVWHTLSSCSWYNLLVAEDQQFVGKTLYQFKTHHSERGIKIVQRFHACAQAVAKHDFNELEIPQLISHLKELQMIEQIFPDFSENLLSLAFQHFTRMVTGISTYLVHSINKLVRKMECAHLSA